MYYNSPIVISRHGVRRNNIKQRNKICTAVFLPHIFSLGYERSECGSNHYIITCVSSSSNIVSMQSKNSIRLNIGFAISRTVAKLYILIFHIQTRNLQRIMCRLYLPIYFHKLLMCQVIIRQKDQVLAQKVSCYNRKFYGPQNIYIQKYILATFVLFSSDTLYRNKHYYWLQFKYQNV